MTVLTIVVVALGASAKDELLRGRATVIQGQPPWSPGAKAASDRYESLRNGQMHPRIDPMQAIINGYVPPGMSPQQSAIIYSGLPNNVKLAPPMPQPGSAEWVARMAGEPTDPLASLAQGVSRNDVQAANEKMFQSYMRERFGPVAIAPLHRDPNQSSMKTTAAQSHIKRDHQMSLIQPQYGFDGGKNGPHSIREMTDSSGNVVAEYGYDPYGRQTRIAGSGPDADFGYASMYVHQPSGLNLTAYRAFDPSLGRWLSRDPIQDKTFRLMPKSPEPRDPTRTLASAAHKRRSRFDPKEVNPYAYVANNPVNWSDPTGLSIGMPKPWRPPTNPIHPPPPGEPGAPGDLYDCYDWCADHNMTLDDYRDCCAWCDEHYVPDPECKNKGK